MCVFIARVKGQKKYKYNIHNTPYYFTGMNATLRKVIYLNLVGVIVQMGFIKKYHSNNHLCEINLMSKHY